MKSRLHIPGAEARALVWTNRHPNQATPAGLVLYRHSDTVLSGTDFRALRDGQGAWIESTHPFRIIRALGLADDEPGIVQMTE